MASQADAVRILIIGGGGHARVIADAVMARSRLGLGMDLIGFLDDDPSLKKTNLLGKPVLGRIHDINKVPHDAVVVGIGDNDIRRELFEQLLSCGETIVSVIHPRTVIAPDIVVGRGVVVFGGVIINTGSTIGDNVILNTACTIDHDCTIGPHVHICPGAHLGGTVSVGEGAFVGIGSSIIQNKSVGEWSVVGAGSAVIRDVEARTTVVGVPTRVVRKHFSVPKTQPSPLQVVSIDSENAWKTALTGAYDFYHLPFYHAIAKNLEQGDPKLFVYQNNGFAICLPLLIRRIDDVPLSLAKEEWFDATSVYGYAGPVTSHSSIPEPIRADFRERLSQILSEMHVVSVFSRLHPLMKQEPVLEGLGAVLSRGHTVSVDLRIPEEAQLAQYRDNHRRSLKKIKQAGAVCFVDEDYRDLDAFIKIYTETMNRVRATEEYIFPADYFKSLIETTEAEVKLIVCKIGSDIAGAGIVVKCGDILQYHLGGTSEPYLKLSPMKCVLNMARHWGYEHGAKVFHLGGGVGTRDDSLYQFKVGFSDRLHEFKTWRWILRQSVYDQLVEFVEASLEGEALSRKSSEFFPRYRCGVDSVAHRLMSAKV